MLQGYMDTFNLFRTKMKNILGWFSGSDVVWFSWITIRLGKEINPHMQPPLKKTN